MPFWSAQQHNYQDTGGLAFSSGTSGYIQVTLRMGQVSLEPFPFFGGCPTIIGLAPFTGGMAMS